MSNERVENRKTFENMGHELKPLWRKFFRYDWKFGLFLIAMICIPRFLLVLQANEKADYSYIGLIMLASAIIPFIFLNKQGRKAIGLTCPRNYSWLLIAMAIGLIFSVALYFAGEWLYGDSYENGYVYIGESYNIPDGINGKDKLTMFLIMAATGMIFSPIGEELFFRGIVHASFAKSLGKTKASIIDSSAFALTHLSHFGLVFINNEWTFFAVPAILWVFSMFLVSLLFFVCRYKSGSLLGAILCHSAFNLGMIYCIFYFIH
ncbi:type II CAAX endopeptidase family protein [Parabacteroides sp. PF5-6]|uniref:CPBP family intramembrane glutamic endopeptidase n=1 Tax=Parabacteroides sp. PF5-6 TaxID=1742403 RepID=UPI00240493DC|nr:type II CAAX endopeptidase family protein [Parabacteroides sp. PF5-6]MDF9829383.1 membrane protease YdiL (CAAX protease family) [Parabacteroides sp. PF5-6]